MTVLRRAAFLLSLCVSICPAGADPGLTDAEKKAIVYRMYADYKKEFPSVADITPGEAMALVKTGPVLFVDTRSAPEMAVSTLPGAVSEAQFRAHTASYRNHTIIAYCTISYRSGKFAEEMAGKGIAVRNLTGGILAWTLEGGKVYDGRGEQTRRIHVYGKKWDFPPAGYESVAFGFWDRWFQGH